MVRARDCIDRLRRQNPKHEHGASADALEPYNLVSIWMDMPCQSLGTTVAAVNDPPSGG